MKKWIWIVILVVIVLVVAAVLAKPKDESVVKIGYFGPFTGPVAGTSGEDVANGFKLAASENNILSNGKKLEVVYEDDACSPQTAVSAAQKLINTDKVKLLVSGVCSGSTVSVMPVAEQNKVILFTPVSTSPKITDGGDYIFRTSASSVVTAQAMSKLIGNSGYHNIAVFFETADYTVSLKDVFVKSWESVPGNKILALESSGSKDVDLKTQISKIAKTKPEALVYIFNSTITASNALKQTKDLNINTPIFGNEYFAFKDVVNNPQAEGVYATQYNYDSKNPSFVSFLNNYLKKYNKTPSQDIYAALGYDGYNVLFKAINHCGGVNVDCVKKELYDTKNFPGITGVITLDKNGDTAREFTVKKIMNKQLVDVK